MTLNKWWHRFILTKIWLVKAYYSAANKDRLAGLERSVNVWTRSVCFMWLVVRGAALSGCFRWPKWCVKKTPAPLLPLSPSLSLCSLERCHLIKPQVLQTGKWKPEVWRNVNELWWEISQCWTECTLWLVSACYYKCYLSAVTTFDLCCTDLRLLTFATLKKNSMYCVAIKCPFKVWAEAVRVFLSTENKIKLNSDLPGTGLYH